MTALAGFNMAAGSTDVRVTWIVSELSRMVSSSMAIVTISDDVVPLSISSLQDHKPHFLLALNSMEK